MKSNHYIYVLFFICIVFTTSGQQTQKISLPAANDAGLTSGALSVSATGAATYNIPITVPPGIKNIAPTISLTYSSQAGNGLAGWGWDIAGLSKISRIPATTYHDGFIAPISFDQDDVQFDLNHRYALDGQRLILDSGTYGVKGSTYQTEKYSNIKIKAYGTSLFGASYGPAYFIVHYPNGSRAWYGLQSSVGRLAWAISKMEDPQGNYVSYTYGHSNGLLHIKSIAYGSKMGSTAPNLIEFTYKDRFRPEQIYVGGIQFMRTKILDKIEVKSGGQLFRKYKLSHSTSANYQRVSSVKESNGSGKSFDPITFEYDTNYSNAIEPVFRFSDRIDPKVSVDKNKLISGDFDGDGMLDIVTNDSEKKLVTAYVDLFNPYKGGISKANEFITQGFEDILTTSYMSPNNSLKNGNTYTVVSERLIRNSENAKVRFRSYRLLPESDQYGKEWVVPTYKPIASVSTRRKIPKRYLSGDFNGDGIIDIIAIQMPYEVTSCNFCSPETVNDPKVHLINLDRFKTTGTIINTGKLNRSIDAEKDEFMVGDFNGDGKSDLYHFHGNSLSVYVIDSTNKLKKIHGVYNNTIRPNYPKLLGDYNGDGKMDFITPPLDENSNKWRVFISTGIIFESYEHILNIPYQRGYSSENNNELEEEIRAPFVEYHYIPQDFNGDGKTDIVKHKVVTSNSNEDQSFERIQIYHSYMGIDDTKVSFSRTPATKTNRNNGVNKYGIPIFLNINFQNSKLEYGYVSDDKIFTYKYGKNIREDMLLRGIKNNGLNNSIEYEGIFKEDPNESYIYTPSIIEESYPYINIDVAPNFKLVKKIKEEGASLRREQRFLYEGAVSHIGGKGFQGFRTLKRTNWDGNGVTAIWNISTHDPQTWGTTKQQWSSTSPSSEPGNYITHMIYDYDTKVEDNKVYSVLPHNVTTTNQLEGITTTQIYSYDEYNSVKGIDTYFSGGYRFEKFTYYNNASAWDDKYHIGKLRKKMVKTSQYNHLFKTEEEYRYDNNLLIESKRRSNNSDWLVESLGYDAFGNRTSSKISGIGITPRTESYKYDPSGRFMIESTDIEGLKTKFNYDSKNGNLLKETDIYNLTTNYKYDGWNRVIEEKNYLNKITTTDYKKGAGGREFMVIETNYPDGGKEKSYIDIYGRNLKNTHLSLNNKWITTGHTEYDILGRVRRVVEPYFNGISQFNTTYYDEYGRPITQQLYTGKTITTSYDGLRTTVNDGTKTVTTTRDAMGNIAEVTDPGGTITYTYYGNGALKSSDYGGHRIQIDIDEWGRKTKLNDPSAGIYTYSHNILGEVTEETTPKGSTTYTYDNYGKVIKKEIKGENTGLVLNYSYESKSKILSVIDAQDTHANTSFLYTYTYDSYQRLTGVVENTGIAGSFENTMSYDQYGRIYRENTITSTLGTSSNVSIRKVYDPSGILIELIDEDSGKSLWKLTDMNQRGQILSGTLGNGMNTTMKYDRYGLPEKIEDKHKDTDVVGINMEYVFNQDQGTLTSRKNRSFNHEESFEYDQLNRLTKIGGKFGKVQRYNNRGGITTNPGIGYYTYNNSNKYQLKDISLNTDGEQYYQRHAYQNITYNAFKKPVEINEQGHGRVSFEYGPMMNRTRAYYGGTDVDRTKRRYHKQYSSITPVEVIYDTVDNSHKIITYVGGDAYTAPIAHIKKTGSDEIDDFYYLHRDYLGSILGISNSAGQTVEKRQFSAWGNIDEFSASNGTTQFNHESMLSRGFTGHEHFFSVSLIHMNGRMYDSQLRRFLSPDNYIQDPYNTQSYNRFGYVWNNPLSYNDPTGEIAWALPVIIGAAIGAGSAAIQGGSAGDILKGGLVGGLAGLAGFGVGNVISGASMFAGSIVGGATGGFVGGAANSWANGGSFGAGIKAGYKGAVVGAVGGTLGQFGGASVFGGMVWGAAAGAVTGATMAVLNGSSIVNGTLWGAASGAAFSAFYSGVEAYGNYRAGHGFRTNNSVIKNYIKNRQYQKAIDFVQAKYNLNGPKMTYDSNLGDYGITYLNSGDISIGIGAFDSSSMLKATIIHEYTHSTRDRVFINGKWSFSLNRKAKWNYNDGVRAYASEITNAGKMHISRGVLGMMTNGNQVNPIWHRPGIVNYKFWRTLPRRF